MSQDEDESFAAQLEALELKQSEEENEDYQWEGFLPVYPPLFVGENKVLVGDQVILPPDLLNQFTREGYQFPLFFKAKNLITETTISCRAYEFTAPPGVAVFSELLMNELFLDNGAFVRLRLCPIPKATFLRLRAEGNEYLRWSNQKAVLETAIKEYGTVTLDTSILLHFGGKSHRFRIVGLEPAPHANLIDTDVTVELEDDVPVDFGFSIGKNSSNDSMIEEAKKEEPEEEKTKTKQNSPESTIAAVPKERRRRRRRGESELEVSETPKPTVTSFSGVAHSLTSNSTRSPSTVQELSSKSTKVSKTTSLNSGNTLETQEQVEQPPNTVLCKFCRRFVPDYSYDRHEAFCSRNNFVCPLCDLSMPKSKEAEHHEQIHKEIPCPDCGDEMEPALIAPHLENTCKRRKLRCEFCMLNFSADEIFDHSSLCGARTERCERCQNYVMLREFSLHNEHNCNPPSIYTQVADVSPISPVSPVYDDYGDGVDDLCFCPYCMAPFMDNEGLIEHITSQLDYLVAIMAQGTDEDISSILVHLGEVKEPEDVEIVVTTALESSSDKDYLSLLLERKTIKLDATLSNDGRSLLHYASQKGKHDAVIALLKYDTVNPNIFDNNRNSPLHLACATGSLDCIRILLETQRTSVKLQNANSQTPLDCCLDSDLSSNVKSSVIALFIEYANMKGISIDKKHIKEIKEGICEALMNSYLQTKEENCFTDHLLEFVWKRNRKVLNQVQRRFMKRIQSCDSDHVSGDVNTGNGSSLVNNSLSVSVLNNGTVPFIIEFVFPDIFGIEFDVNERKEALGVNEVAEFVVRVDFEAEFDPLNGNCVLVKCMSKKNASKQLGPFYCLVPIQSEK